MTAERAARLTALGFIWDDHDAVWELQLGRLTAYKAIHGDCDVPKMHAKDKPALGRWVFSQRTRKKALDCGEPCEGMTAERAARLTALGFMWDGKWNR
jgi:hypothetical protein